MEVISGFSKLSKEQKLQWLCKNCPSIDKEQIKAFWHQDESLQKTFDEFSENTVSNFYFPFGLAPNFLIDGHNYTIPMVIEESSVVAAASKSAKFWHSRGGFSTQIVGTQKRGHIHFFWSGNSGELNQFFENHKIALLNSTAPLTANMDKRGGGITGIELINKSLELEDYYQIQMCFETCDAMGANFINSVLECVAQEFEQRFLQYSHQHDLNGQFSINMAILSNYTPECAVTARVQCSLEELGSVDGMTSLEFAHKFVQAMEVARVDRSRAVTHNKGILNGVDSLILATGNDFRAVEACVHAYASRDGQYRSLSSARVENGQFLMELTLPLALGTVGGLTHLHPLAKASLEILGNPSAKELMAVVASVGLAQNFAAVRSLVTTGIQKGHMKMHLLNILNQLGADQVQIEAAKNYFADKTISYNAVAKFLS